MQIRVSSIGVFLITLSQIAFSQGRHNARSMVVTQYGIVATSHTLASQAGAEILRKGGSAIDAAIAANAAIGFIEPMKNGIGGEPDRKSTRLNSSHTVISYAVFCLKKKMCE